MAHDVVTQAFAKSQYDQLAGFCQQTDLLDVALLAPALFRLRYRCRTIIRTADGFAWSDTSRMLIRVPERYLFEDPKTNEVLQWEEPLNIWNVNSLFALVCIGVIRRNTSLMDLVFRVHGVLVWRSANLADPLNPFAAEWARKVLDPEIPCEDLALVHNNARPPGQAGRSIAEWVVLCRREGRLVPTDRRPLKWRKAPGGAA